MSHEKLLEDQLQRTQKYEMDLFIQLRRAESIILQLTMHHHSDPEYVKGYDMAQEYFADYPK